MPVLSAPSVRDSLVLRSAKIVGNRHPRRLLPAAGIMKQNSTDSGIPPRFNPLGDRASVLTLTLVSLWRLF
jgi:hypothetical protein